MTPANVMLGGMLSFTLLYIIVTPVVCWLFGKTGDVFAATPTLQVSGFAHKAGLKGFVVRGWM
jgi:hypothetical protein